MRTAVLGWGSLIWCPGSLRIESGWHEDGPQLPIEFARISQRDRVTLVLVPHVPTQPTFWALSEFDEIEPSVENLRIREGTINRHVHWLTHDEGAGGIDRRVLHSVRDWLDRRDDIDAAVWTGLPSNWCEKRERDFNPGEVVSYLRSLIERDESRDAETYFRNAPDSIRTEVRRRVEDEFGWTPRTLPSSLFESSE